MEKVKKTILTAVYIVGFLIVIVLLLLTALGPHCVLFPDAMLPMDLRELTLAWLAIGFLPMLLASMRFHELVRRKVVFLPAIMCLLALLFWIGTWILGMFRSPAMASGGNVGTSRLFLYRNEDGVMAEQPFQGIYWVDDEGVRL